MRKIFNFIKCLCRIRYYLPKYRTQFKILTTKIEWKCWWLSFRIIPCQLNYSTDPNKEEPIYRWLCFNWYLKRVK